MDLSSNDPLARRRASVARASGTRDVTEGLLAEIVEVFAPLEARKDSCRDTILCLVTLREGKQSQILNKAPRQVVNWIARMIWRQRESEAWK